MHICSKSEPQEMVQLSFALFILVFKGDGSSKLILDFKKKINLSLFEFHDLFAWLYISERFFGRPENYLSYNVRYNFAHFVVPEPIGINRHFSVFVNYCHIRLQKISMGNLTDQHFSKIVFVLP